VTSNDQQIYGGRGRNQFELPPK